jgi:hypothetical protein
VGVLFPVTVGDFVGVGVEVSTVNDVGVGVKVGVKLGFTTFALTEADPFWGCGSALAAVGKRQKANSKNKRRPFNFKL